MTVRRGVVIVALGAIGLNLASACRQVPDDDISLADVASVYAGENIRFIVPSAPGGGFDQYARLLVPFLEKYSGASVQVENLPGAGGVRAVTDLYDAPKNGMTIGIMNGSAMVSNSIAGLRGADYRVEEFEYLGRVVADPRILSMATASNITSIDDIWNATESVKIGATGLGGSAYVDGMISKEVFDLNVQIVHGFDSSSVVRQAMLRGNIAGTWGSLGSAERAVNAGLEKIILQSGKERLPELPDVPTVFEFVDKTDNPARARTVLNAWNSLISIGRPVATTPGTPAVRVAFLRAVFAQAMHDPEFLEAASVAGRVVHYASGDEVMEIIKDATELDDDTEQLFIQVIRGDLQ